jgi:hypothetical protein
MWAELGLGRMSDYESDSYVEFFFPSFKKQITPSVVIHVYNTSTWETEAGG